MVITKKQETPRCSLYVDGKQLKQVNNFIYLGSKITEDARADMEIKRRISEAKRALDKMRQTITNNHLSIKTRKRAVKTYIWSVLLYGCETWTISKNMEKRLEAAEMWIWRRVLKIPWTDRVTNDAVLRRMGTHRELLKSIRKRQLRFLGHVMRKGELENVCLTGRVEGRRARGRESQIHGWNQ